MIHAIFTKKTLAKQTLFLTLLFAAIIFGLLKISYHGDLLKWVGVAISVAIFFYYLSCLSYYWDGSFMVSPTELIQSDRRMVTRIKTILWADVTDISVVKKGKRIMHINVIRKSKSDFIFLSQGLENEKEVFDFIIAKGKELNVLKEKTV